MWHRGSLGFGGRLLLFWFCLYRSGENFIFFVVKKLRWSKHLNLLHPVRPSVILSLHPLTWPRRPQLPWFPEPDGPPASWISPAPVRGSPCPRQPLTPASQPARPVSHGHGALHMRLCGPGSSVPHRSPLSLKRETLQRGEEERVPGELTLRVARQPRPTPTEREKLLNWAGRGGL